MYNSITKADNPKITTHVSILRIVDVVYYHLPITRKMTEAPLCGAVTCVSGTEGSFSLICQFCILTCFIPSYYQAFFN